MEQLHFITKLLDIKNSYIKIMKKYDFQKTFKIPYLETTGIPTMILLRKRRFKYYQHSKMMVYETSLVKKNHKIPRIVNQKIAQKIIEMNTVTDIVHQFPISTSTVIRKINNFHFQKKEPDKFFGLIEDNLKKVYSLFQAVFKIFLKDKEKIFNALQLSYSNAKLEATNNLIKRNDFDFQNFENFKKRIFIVLNIKKERTKFVLSRF